MTKNITFSKIGIALFGILLSAVVGRYLLYNQATHGTASVVKTTWDRQLVVERYLEVQEEDWHVPVGAQVVGSNKAIRRYARRIVGWREECHKEGAKDNYRSGSSIKGGVEAAGIQEGQTVHPPANPESKDIPNRMDNLKERAARAPKVKRETEESERSARTHEKLASATQGAKKTPPRDGGNSHVSADTNPTAAGHDTTEQSPEQELERARYEQSQRGYGEMDMKDPREPLDMEQPVDPNAVPYEARDEEYEEPHKPEPATGCRMVALYKSVPVYATKYRFLVWRWVPQPDLHSAGENSSTRHWPEFQEDEHNRVIKKEETLHVELAGSLKTYRYKVGPEIFDYASEHIGDDCKVRWSFMRLFSINCAQAAADKGEDNQQPPPAEAA